MGSTEPPRSSAQKPQITLLLAAPRGFCAGVERAIRIVETALTKYGPPVYMRHEIVHNRHVVRRLQDMGAVFVSELDEVPEGAKVIFSAHGVAKSVPAAAAKRKLVSLDATCPLVSKVHAEAERHFASGRHVLLIGHGGHPEVEGTIGQLPKGAITLIETREDADAFSPDDPERLAFITQTTLSVDDTHEIVAALRARFPHIAGPRKEDICYATTNRQQAIKSLAAGADLVLIVGAPNSSNSQRLVEVARRAGAKQAVLIENAAQIDWRLTEGISTVAVSAGASAPEALVGEVVEAFRARYEVDLKESTAAREDVHFNVPRTLAS
jgi:4-hydroxy-3-methylbut-2-en-1-yl diphosphate reductase